jgi:hypothetical protein
MNKRTSHISKTPSEKVGYQQAISRTNSGPTLDDALDFEPSNKLDTEIIDKPQRKRRPSPWYKKFYKKLTEYAIQIVVGVIVTVVVVFGGFLLVGARTAISSIEKDIEIQQRQLDQLSADVSDNDVESKRQIQLLQDNINTIRDKIDDSTKIDHTQDILLAELKLRIDFMFAQINKNPNGE